LGEKAIKQFPLTKGVKNVTNNPLKAIIGRGWEPKLAVTGASGFPDVAVAGNVMRTHSTLKLSIRLPPTFDAEQAKKIITDLLTKDVPYNAKVTLDKWQQATGWNAPEYSPFLENAIKEASKTCYGKSHLCMAEGGSIPLMGMFAKAFPKAEFIVTGVLGPEANAHGPNEFLHLDYCKKLMTGMTLILARVSEHFEALGVKK